MISITTDYATVDRGDPSPYLRRIAEAGFTHVHWCHHWNTDFIYTVPEIEQIRRWLEAFGLKLLDLHAPVGPERNWFSANEWERQAGVEVVKNRLEMTARLGGDAIVMHIAGQPGSPHLHRSLDALEPVVRQLSVRIALENGPFDAVDYWLAHYGPEFLGLCYDSGHGNLTPDGLERLSRLADRLLVVHLHDNDGGSDQHDLIFSGTVDWEKLARILAHSAYDKPISSESNMGRSGITEEMEFLARAYQAGQQLTTMVQKEK